MSDTEWRTAFTKDSDVGSTEERLLMQMMHSRMSRGCNISEYVREGEGSFDRPPRKTLLVVEFVPLRDRESSK